MGYKHTFKLKPFEHQIRALTKMARLGFNGALLMEQGTGKTKVVIDAISILRNTKKIKYVLIVCPISVPGVWISELEANMNDDYLIANFVGQKSASVEAMLKYALKNPSPTLMIAIINYDITWRVPSLSKFPWDVVIADESQKIKHHTSRRSKALHRLSNSPYKFILTGTPITNSVMDLYSQFRFLNPSRFGTSWNSFRLRYGIWGGFHERKLLGIQNLEELIERKELDSFRVLKSECLDLPPKTFVNVPFDLDPKVRNIYDQMKENFIAEIEDLDHNKSIRILATIILTKIMKLSQIASGFIKDENGNAHSLSQTRIDITNDLVSNILESTNRVIVYTKFIWEFEELSKMLKKTALVLPVRGETPSDIRIKEFEIFQSSHKKNIILLSMISTGSLGITLTSASNVIFHNISWSVDQYTQAQDRIHRIGQNSSKVTYYHILARNTVDVLILRSLRDKRKISKMVLDDPRLLS